MEKYKKNGKPIEEKTSRTNVINELKFNPIVSNRLNLYKKYIGHILREQPMDTMSMKQDDLINEKTKDLSQKKEL